MPSIISFLRETALRFPDIPVVSDFRRTISYRELWQKIQCLALWLREHFPAGSRILVEARPAVSFVVSAMGIELAGCVFVPVEKNISYDVFLRLAEDLNPVLFIGEKKIDSVLCIPPDRIWEISEMSSDNTPALNIPEEVQLAEILYTTGITGHSKGVMLSHRAVFAASDNSYYLDQLNTDSVYLIASPLNHISTLRKLYSCFLGGAHAVLLDGFFDVKKYYETVEKFRVNFLLLPPSAIRFLLFVSKEKLHTFSEQIKGVYTTSAPMTETDKETLHQCLPKSNLIFGYGATEAGSCTAYDYTKFSGMANCVGRPSPHTKITIVDEQHQKIDSSQNNPGYLAISGDNLMNGYWNDSVRTSEVLSENQLYTNDLGYIDKNGFVYVIGRKGDIINSGGLKIAPTEVENVVMRYAGIRDCACFGVKDPIAGTTVKLNIVLDDQFHFDLTAFRNFLQNYLEPYQIPAQIECLKEIPKTHNGKIDRKRLK